MRTASKLEQTRETTFSVSLSRLLRLSLLRPSVIFGSIYKVGRYGRFHSVLLLVE